MAPWGVTTPTGHVFYTTKKKINEIVCKSPLSLTSEQMEQIEAYKKAINTPKVIIESQATGTTPITPEVGLNSKNNQIASLGNTSFTNKILHPIKWMFGN